MFLGFKLSLTQALQAHRHNMHEFVVCLSGHGHYLIGDECYECTPGRTLFIPSRILHGINTLDNQPLDVYFFCVEPDKFNQLIPGIAAQDLRRLLSGVSIAKSDSAVSQRALSIAEKVLVESDSLIESPSYMVVALLNELLASHLSTCESMQGLQWEFHSKSLQKVMDWIAENFAQEISVDTMADRANMSRSTFTRQFRKHTGMSLIDYCLQLRIQAATDALANSDTPITELAYDCGFTNLSYFHRVFRRHTSMSPGEYRSFLRFQGVK